MRLYGKEARPCRLSGLRRSSLGGVLQLGMQDLPAMEQDLTDAGLTSVRCAVARFRRIEA